MTSFCISHLTSVVCFDTTKLCSLKVLLLPSVLARKRVWNPKYPICIRLAGGDNSQEGEGGRSEEKPGAEPSSPQLKDLEPTTTLYLFGRTGREKEEWFHHFLLASVDTERDQEKEGEKPGRCVFRSGMRDVNKALERRQL